MNSVFINKRLNYILQLVEQHPFHLINNRFFNSFSKDDEEIEAQFEPPIPKKVDKIQVLDNQEYWLYGEVLEAGLIPEEIYEIQDLDNQQPWINECEGVVEPTLIPTSTKALKTSTEEVEIGCIKEANELQMQMMLQIYARVKKVMSNLKLTKKQRQEKIEKMWHFNVHDAYQSKPSIYHLAYFIKLLGKKKLNSFNTSFTKDYINNPKGQLEKNLESIIDLLIDISVKGNRVLSPKSFNLKREEKLKLRNYMKQSFAIVKNSNNLVTRIFIHTLVLASNFSSSSKQRIHYTKEGFVTVKSKITDPLKEIGLGVFYGLFREGITQYLLIYDDNPLILDLRDYMKKEDLKDSFRKLKEIVTNIMFTVLSFMIEADIIEAKKVSKGKKKQWLLFIPIAFNNLAVIIQPMPMIIKPRNWNKVGRKGGFLMNSSQHNKQVVKNMFFGDSFANLSPLTIKALNLIQRKAYTICPIALDILKNVFKHKYSQIREEFNLITRLEYKNLVTKEQVAYVAVKPYIKKSRYIWQQWWELKAVKEAELNTNRKSAAFIQGIIKFITKYKFLSLKERQNFSLLKKSYLDLLFSFNYQKECKDLQSRIIGWKELARKRQAARNRYLLWKQTCLVAEIFKDQKFYFPNFFDFRLRFYPQTHLFTRTSGVYKYLVKSYEKKSCTPEGRYILLYSLGVKLQEENSILKDWNFEAWYNKMETDPNHWWQKIKGYDSIQFLSRYKNAKDIFRALLLFLEIQKAFLKPNYKLAVTIEYDQRCSGMQISALVFADPALADASFGSPDLDIYGLVQKLFLEQWFNPLLESFKTIKEGEIQGFLKNKLEVSSKYYNLSRMVSDLSLNLTGKTKNPLEWKISRQELLWLLNELKYIFNQRKTYKYMVMCSNYSQGNFNRTKEHVWEPLINSNLEYFNKWNKTKEDFIFLICLNITKYYDTLINKTFPNYATSLLNLNKWVEHICSVKQKSLQKGSNNVKEASTNWLTLDGSSISYTYLKTSWISSRYYDGILKRFISNRLYLSEKKNYDKSQHMTSFIANFIHSYDGAIMRLIILRFFKKTKYILEPLHDSIGVHPNDFKLMISSIQEVYYELNFNKESLREVLFNQNIEGSKGDQDQSSLLWKKIKIDPLEFLLKWDKWVVKSKYMYSLD